MNDLVIIKMFSLKTMVALLCTTFWPNVRPKLLQVGDFVFLSLRTRSSNLNVLNRERTPRYRLEIRAKVRRRGDGKRVRMKEPKCVVDVEVSALVNSKFYRRHRLYKPLYDYKVVIS